jgi:hypothetical protein
MKDSVPLEQVRTDIDALVTGDATDRLEEHVAVVLLGRERRSIALEPAIKPASRCEQ